MFFSCKKRTKRTLNKNPPQGITLRGIFSWNFFGSFFAKKEQPIAIGGHAPTRAIP